MYISQTNHSVGEVSTGDGGKDQDSSQAFDSDSENDEMQEIEEDED